MSTIKLGTHDTVEVELFEHVFTVQRVTKSLIAKLRELGEPDGKDPDAYVRGLSKGLDLRLKAVEKGTPKPSTLLVAAWDEDRLTVPQLEALCEDINSQDRPT
jgi:hypothetical protein